MYVADALSRAPACDSCDSTIKAENETEWFAEVVTAVPPANKDCLTVYCTAQNKTKLALS